MVEWKKLGEVCEILDSQRKPVAKGDRAQGIYPYYGANGVQDYVDDYLFDGTFLLMGEDGSVINKDKSPVLNWANGKIWVNNHAHILKENNIALLRFLFYILQCTDVSDIVRGVPPKINQANMRNIQIPIPPLSEQNRIVDILDTFTSSIENLKQQIAQRRKQYEYYRDQLLDLEGKEGVKIKKLGDVCDFIRGPFGGALKKEIFVKSGYAIYEQQHAIYGKWIFRYYIDTKKFEEMKRFEVHSGDILMSCSGTMGKTAIVPENHFPGIINQALLKLSVKLNIYNSFLKLFMDSRWFQEGLKNKTAGGAIQNVASVSILKELEIPLPSLEEQNRIVSILDTFEASISNLEAQLKEREKQYEYYRNKLLTFD